MKALCFIRRSLIYNIPFALQIIEPIKQLEWSKHEFELFLDALINCEDGIKPLMK